MELLDDIIIRCHRCGNIIGIHKTNIEFDSYVYDHGDRGMGVEIEYIHEGCIECEQCGNEILFRIIGNEYPAGAYNYDDFEISGGEFEYPLRMGVIYCQDDFDYFNACDEYSRIETLIKDIANDNDLLYGISSREFEEIIERIFQDEGFETELTKQTRDGGRDIVATKYEMGQPIVFYVECKKYGKKNTVGVNIVRSLYGVQCSDRVNKAILVTTGHVTSGARKFVEDQNVLMGLIDVDDIHRLIKRSALKYQNR